MSPHPIRPGSLGPVICRLPYEVRSRLCDSLVGQGMCIAVYWGVGPTDGQTTSEIGGETRRGSFCKQLLEDSLLSWLPRCLVGDVDYESERGHSHAAAFPVPTQPAVSW